MYHAWMDIAGKWMEKDMYATQCLSIVEWKKKEKKDKSNTIKPRAAGADSGSEEAPRPTCCAAD